jgi:hypothetical protein
MFSLTDTASAAVRSNIAGGYVLTKNTNDILPFANLIFNSLITLLKGSFLSLVDLPRIGFHDLYEASDLLYVFVRNKIGYKFAERRGANIAHFWVQNSPNMKVKRQQTDGRGQLR